MADNQPQPRAGTSHPWSIIYYLHAKNVKPDTHKVYSCTLYSIGRLYIKLVGHGKRKEVRF